MLRRNTVSMLLEDGNPAQVDVTTGRGPLFRNILVLQLVEDVNQKDSSRSRPEFEDLRIVGPGRWGLPARFGDDGPHSPD